MGNNHHIQTAINAAIHCEVKIMRHVLSSAPEAEIAALFHNAQKVIPLCQLLIELGHTQPATPIQTDNSVAASFAASTIKQRRSKTIDMRYYWLQDRQQMKQIDIYWQPKKLNLADYFSKHHPIHHHKSMRPVVLYPSS